MKIEEQSRSITVCINILIFELFLAFGPCKAYLKPAQKTRKDSEITKSVLEPMSEIPGGGCCGKFRIKLFKVYITLFPLILVAILKAICVI